MLGPWELFIILLIVLVLFGVGRLGKLGSELGKGISAFKAGLREGDSNEINDPHQSDDNPPSKNNQP